MHHDERIERFYTSTAWRKCRIAYLQNVGGLCEHCIRKGIIEPATDVHHKKPITPETVDDSRITLSWDNLVALCEDCHREQHTKRRWRCEPNGHVNL